MKLEIIRLAWASYYSVFSGQMRCQFIDLLAKILYKGKIASTIKSGNRKFNAFSVSNNEGKNLVQQVMDGPEALRTAREDLDQIGFKNVADLSVWNRPKEEESAGHGVDDCMILPTIDDSFSRNFESDIVLKE